MEWFRPYAADFLERFQQAPNELNFFALMGIIAGTLASHEGPVLAKDYRTYEDLPGFAALEEFRSALEGGAAQRRGSTAVMQAPQASFDPAPEARPSREDLASPSGVGSNPRSRFEGL